MLQILQHVHHLGLNGAVQGRDGLIAHDKFRIDGKGSGNSDSLALSSGKFVGEFHHIVGLHPYLVEQILDPVSPLSLFHTDLL